ncbi:MAG: alpha/beta hydrolase [Sphingomonadales bacterium]|nr:alpha/beta hydrolase [Sphingomonadales bacterium]
MTDLSGQTFVLVHGAWHGGWCWRDVAARLRSRGALVHTPTLTGLGDKKHLRAAYQGLQTFITDVAATIETEELQDVVLVGHSFGGMVITGVADRMAERIKRLVYLDAFAPNDGQSVVTCAPGASAESMARLRRSLEAQAWDGEWIAPPPAELVGLHLATAELRDWDLRNMTEQPLSSFVEPLPLVHGRPEIPSTYIVCDNPPMPGTPFVAHHKEVAAGAYGSHWIARRIDTGHMAMITALDETVELLTEAASG